MITFIQTDAGFEYTVAMLRNNKTVKVTEASFYRFISLWSKPKYFKVFHYRENERLITHFVKE